jgi:murein endopeptidase
MAAVVVVVVGFIVPEDALRPDAATQAELAEAAAKVKAVPDEAPDPSEASDDTSEVPPDPEALDDQVAEAVEGEAPAPAPVELPSGEIVYVYDDERAFIEHVVAPVETLEQIAFRYDVRPDGLRMWNGLADGVNELKNGTTLRVKPRRIPPPRVRYEYTVQPGDSWWKIGSSFGVDSYDLRAYNWDGQGRLRVGQRLEMWLDPVIFEWIAVEEDPDDPVAIRPGAASIGPPQGGRLINGVEIPEAPYYTLKYSTASYGTSHAVTYLMEALARFEARYEYERPLRIAAMSRKHGGPLQGHRSHQTGRDLDIRLPLRMEVPEDYSVRPDRVDWEAVWHLVSAFVDTGEVVVIFLDYSMQEHVHTAAKKIRATTDERRRLLQYPQGERGAGLVRHAPGHEAHIHVRFACGPHEPECIQLAKDDDSGD